MRVLIIEDEEKTADYLHRGLTEQGFSVDLARDGIDGLHLALEGDYAVIVLDVMLPGLDGWEVLQLIREHHSCPVIMLTARDGITDRLHGLDSGADDYMTKPFMPEEVVARVHAVLRRRPFLQDRSSKRHFGNLVIDDAAKCVYLNGAEVGLSPRDLSLLLFLSEYPNRTFTRDHLIEQVWGMDYEGSDRAVDLSVKRLRQSLSHWSSDAGEIRTLRGMGYQFWINE